MKWDFDNDRPIYIQLIEGLKTRIITGVYNKGEKIPSVRDLALETKVNPNTMQRALAELESSGLVYSVRTSGRYVTEDTNKIEEIKNSLAKEKVNVYLHEMKKLGFSKQEAILKLKREEENNENSGM